MHKLYELPPATRLKKSYFLAALGIFVLVAVLFYFPLWSDLQAYGSADWDYSNFVHAVGVWSVKNYHEFPLWNPYMSGGTSFIGNPQSPSPLSITFLMSYLIGPVAGIKIGNILNALVGMCGMYVLMGYFDMIWIARILASVVLILNGTLVYHVTQGHFMWMMLMYWPWMLFFFLKSFGNRLWIYLAALMLSVQFLGGAPYLFAFAVIVFGMLTLLFALRDKKAEYLLRFAEMMAAFVVFCGPKLFMVMETLYRFPRVTINEDAQVPWNVFYYAFLCRDQINNHIPGLKVDEFSAYVGLIPVLLTLLVFFQWKKYWPYLGVFIFSLGLALGNSPYSPFWPIFHLLGAGYFHFSTRSFLISVFFISMFCGFSLSFLILLFKEEFPVVVLLSLVAVVFVIVDFSSVLNAVGNITRTNARQYQDFQVAMPFSQLEVTEKQRYRFGNSSMLDLLLRNTGTANGYDPLPITSRVIPKNSANYKGECYLQSGYANPEIMAWSPNKWVVKLQVPQEDMLIINQNYDPGWKTSPSRKVLNVNGLLGVAVTPEDSKITFYYLPFNFILGCWVSFLGILTILWDVIRGRK